MYVSLAAKTELDPVCFTYLRAAETMVWVLHSKMRTHVMHAHKMRVLSIYTEIDQYSIGLRVLFLAILSIFGGRWQLFALAK